MQKKETYALSIDIAANFIENSIGKICKPYPEGIYLLGQEEPVVLPNTGCYRIERSEIPNIIMNLPADVDPATIPPTRVALIEVPVNTIEDVRGYVYNQDGEILITRQQSMRKETFLATQPMVPVNGRKIARAYIQDLLDRLQVYKKNPHANSHLIDCYNELVRMEYKDNQQNFMLMEEMLGDAMMDISYDIRQYFGNQTWDVLIMEAERSEVTIRNVGDFRIHEYHRVIEGKEEEKS